MRSAVPSVSCAREILHPPPGRTVALPPARVRGPQPSALKLSGRTFISAGNVQKWVRSPDAERKAAAPAARGGGPARPHPARSAAPAAFRKSRWRCGPLPALPPPAETAPRRHSAPEGAGPIPQGRGRGKEGRIRGRGLAGPANHRGGTAAGERGRRRLPSPIHPRPDPHPGPGGSREGTGDAAGAPGGAGPENRRPIPGRREKGGASRARGRGAGAPEGEASAPGMGAWLRPPQGEDPEGLGAPEPEGAGAARAAQESGGGAQPTRPGGLGEQAGACGAKSQSEGDREPLREGEGESSERRERRAAAARTDSPGEGKG